MPDLTLNPTPEEIEEAAKDGWYFEPEFRVWSKYDAGCVRTLSLAKFETVYGLMSRADELVAEGKQIFSRGFKALDDGIAFFERLRDETEQVQSEVKARISAFLSDEVKRRELALMAGKKTLSFLPTAMAVGLSWRR